MNTLTIIRIAAALLLGAASVTGWAVQRTFVASYGLDTNPCTLTSPCRGFAAAIAATDANGEVIVLDSAGYGPVAISQSVSIIAPEGVYAGISVFPGNDGIAIFGGARVILRGLSINGLGGIDGIFVESAAEVVIDKCVLSNMTESGVTVAAPAKVLIHDTTILGSGMSGISINANASVTVHRSRILRSGFSAVATGTDSARLTVTESVLSGNGLYGLEVLPSTGGTIVASVHGSVIEGNLQGGIFAVFNSTSPATYSIDAADNVIRNNGGGGGIAFLASATDNFVGVATGNTIINNAGTGILAAGAGATVIAHRNVVARNAGVGLLQASGASFKSMGNNEVENNLGGNTSGTITTVLAK